MSVIRESEMLFGDFPEENLFQIENSQLQLSFGRGIKTVEFILLRKNEKLLFVEAKQSCPNSANKNENKDKEKSFEEYYSEIEQKFEDSLQMFLTSVLKRNSYVDGIGVKLKEKKDYTKTGICFILVIKNAKDETWLAGPKTELEDRLKRIVKIWDVKILVLNEQMAMEYGLVTGEYPGKK